MSLILRPLLYFNSTIFRRYSQVAKVASIAPAIIYRCQRKKKKKKGQQCMCLLSPIYPDSFQLCSFPSPSALCFSRLAWVGYISGFLALCILIGSAHRIHCRRLECEKRTGSGFFPSLTPFLQSHTWLAAT